MTDFKADESANMKSGEDVFSLASTTGGGARPKLAPSHFPDRTPEMDLRIGLHESGHILCGKAFGFPVALATINPAGGYGGMVSASADSSFLSPEHVADLCARVRPLMPQIGEPRADGNEFYAHAHFRTVELLAGTEAERLFHTDDPPLRAEHDLQEARSFAGIICTSPASIDAFIEFARVEARAMLADHRHVVLALATRLVERRTLDGTEIDAIIAQAVAGKELADERARRAGWKRTETNAARLPEYQSAMRRGGSRAERIDLAVSLIREGANLRQACEAVRLPNAERDVARRCDQRGVPRKRSPALPQWKTHVPDPVIVKPGNPR
jgi:hypothetical protein